MNEEFTRRLRLGPQEYDALLGRMKSGAGTRATDGRLRTRFDYRVPDIPMLIEHPEGGASRFLVFGRNISRSGISVLHGGFVHTASTCQVVLRQADNRALAVRGTVVHCRLVAGSCHEIGIRFDKEIDPEQLHTGASAAGERDAEAATGGLEPLKGRIILAESFTPDLLLLQHHLEIFGLDIEVAETPGAVLDTVKRGSVDLVLFGLSLTQDDGLRTIQRVRECGCRAPIIVLTAETNGDALLDARRKGATDVIAKPYHIDFLVAQLRAHLGEGREVRVRYSTAGDQPGMPPLIESYVSHVRRVADRMERSRAEGDRERLAELCRQLKGSGCGYGFQDVTVAAMTALAALDAGASTDETDGAIDRLLACCRSLEARPGATAACANRIAVHKLPT